MSPCELCDGAGGEVLLDTGRLRVVAVDEALHPGFCRVIWADHVREMTDLLPADRQLLMAAVFATELALRAVLAPAKVNLASLGNLTPHLHWHVIARFAQDPHFPSPIWAPPRHQMPASLPADWRAQVRRQLAQWQAQPGD